jgi:hypothetical protein
VWAAFFVVCFDLYWVLKAINGAAHLITAYRYFQVCVRVDWLELIKHLPDSTAIDSLLGDKAVASKGLAKRYYLAEQQRLITTQFGAPSLDYLHYYHVVVLPFVKEGFEVLNSTVAALTTVQYPKDRIILVLASEERAGEPAQEVARQIIHKYGKQFFKTYVTVHPDGLEGEIKGKSANTSWAVSSLVPTWTNELGLSIDQILVSNFDSDTIVHPQYFARVMYAFLTSSDPYHQSYQPIAVYNNNIWDSPAFVRVVSVSSSFWQFTESSRPDRLRTFSSHTMTLRALVDVGYWKKDIINEDGYIYWQCYLHYEGNYRVAPLFIPVSLDTCMAETFWQTLKNQYTQRKRWAYNVEYYPHLVPALLKNGAPLGDRLYKLFQYVEGNFNWATASVLILVLGRLPLLFGGDEFRTGVVAFNLPVVTQVLLTIAAGFLIFSVYINLILLPKRPARYSVWRSIMMYVQWILVPITSITFGSLPAIEAQTRLLFGWYLEFWVTPKTRMGETTAFDMKEMEGVKP